jgi:hypothetical protein
MRIVRSQPNRELVLKHHSTMLMVQVKYTLQHCSAGLSEAGKLGQYLGYFAIAKFLSFYRTVHGLGGLLMIVGPVP